MDTTHRVILDMCTHSRTRERLHNSHHPRRAQGSLGPQHAFPVLAFPIARLASSYATVTHTHTHTNTSFSPAPAHRPPRPPLLLIPSATPFPPTIPRVPPAPRPVRTNVPLLRVGPLRRSHQQLEHNNAPGVGPKVDHDEIESPVP